MAATGLQINWTDVSYGGTTIDRVTSLQFQEANTPIEWRGDTDLYPSVVAMSQLAITASLTTGNTGALLGLNAGVTAPLLGTHKDAKGQSSGDIVYSMTAELTGRTTGGGHGQWGQGTAEFTGRSIDGVTSPLSFTRA